MTVPSLSKNIYTLLYVFKNILHLKNFFDHKLLNLNKISIIFSLLEEINHLTKGNREMPNQIHVILLVADESDIS